MVGNLGCHLPRPVAKSVMALLVRQAEVADAGAIATSHIRSWQAGYANVISSELLRDLSSQLAHRTLRWQTIILGAEARRPLRARGRDRW